MTLSVYHWEDVHRYFPQEVIEQYRKKIIEEWKSGKFKDREIWERYGMSENAFYDLIKRYSEEGNLKDKSSRPKNPSHKLGQEEMQKIINKAREDRDKIKVLQSAFETDMKTDGRSLSLKKLERLKDSMNRAIPGVRKIGHRFNICMQDLGKDISIGKSRVHEILTFAGIFKKEKKIEMKSKHLSRPEKPMASFSMDFTQKRIGNGEIGYVFGLLDMHNDAFVTLTGHPEKNGDIVAKNLEILKQIQPQDQKMEIRSDCGKEFYNESVRNFCNKNNIHLHFIPKGSPWLQAFIERGFRTIKEEFLNLVWIGNWNKFNDMLRDARYGYNHRPNSAFNYKNPLEVMATKIPNLPQQVCGH
jgi:transposase InsO family protein